MLALGIEVSNRTRLGGTPPFLSGELPAKAPPPSAIAALCAAASRDIWADLAVKGLTRIVWRRHRLPLSDRLCWLRVSIDTGLFHNIVFGLKHFKYL